MNLFAGCTRGDIFTKGPEVFFGVLIFKLLAGKEAEMEGFFQMGRSGGHNTKKIKLAIGQVTLQ